MTKPKPRPLPNSWMLAYQVSSVSLSVSGSLQLFALFEKTGHHKVPIGLSRATAKNKFYPNQISYRIRAFETSQSDPLHCTFQPKPTSTSPNAVGRVLKKETNNMPSMHLTTSCTSVDRTNLGLTAGNSFLPKLRVVYYETQVRERQAVCTDVSLYKHSYNAKYIAIVVIALTRGGNSSNK